MDNSNLDHAMLEHMFRQNNVVIVGFTSPTKRAIQTVAASRHISMSDLIREAVVAHMKATYPDYEKLYRQYLREEAQKMIKGDVDDRS